MTAFFLLTDPHVLRVINLQCKLGGKQLPAVLTATFDQAAWEGELSSTRGWRTSVAVPTATR